MMSRFVLIAFVAALSFPIAAELPDPNDILVLGDFEAWLFAPRSSCERLAAILHDDGYRDTDLGFGIRRCDVLSGTVDLDLYVIAIEVDREIVALDVDIGSTESWTDEHFGRWQSELGAQRMAESGSRYRFDFSFERLVERLARELGPQRPVDVPAALAGSYRALTDPFESFQVGFDCGIAGGPPRGFEMIRALESADRFDLIENVLRGPSPGGRVYAAIVLSRTEARGRRVDPEVKRRIEKVVGLPILLEHCYGCPVREDTAAVIVPFFLSMEGQAWGAEVGHVPRP